MLYEYVVRCGYFHRRLFTNLREFIRPSDVPLGNHRGEVVGYMINNHTGVSLNISSCRYRWHEFDSFTFSHTKFIAESDKFILRMPDIDELTRLFSDSMNSNSLFNKDLSTAGIINKYVNKAACSGGWDRVWSSTGEDYFNRIYIDTKGRARPASIDARFKFIPFLEVNS